jgi:uroporphyrinogen decarboxylase
MMFGAPEVWDALMRKIAGISAAYLEVQAAAGASAVQLFDSWAGALTPADYAANVAPYSAAVLERAGALGVPRIHFGVGTANLLGLMGEAGGDVVGVDWRTPLATAIGQVGDRALQGNLDPTLVFAPTEVMTQRAAEIIEAGRAARGHVFNLGHGVLPSTDPDQLHRLTEFVQSYPL